jgi:hypothetical protein
MAQPTAPAIGEGPIGFTDTNGSYFLIPLTALSFDASGALKPDNWPGYAAHKTQIDPFFQRLQAEGTIQKGVASPAKPAFTVTAVTPGSSSVVVVMTIANVVPNVGTPASSTADVSATETDTYLKLPLAKLIETIGNVANGGTVPGLAFVTGAAPTDLPAVGSYPFAIASPGSAATAAIPKSGGGTTFTLQARSSSADGALLTANVSDVDAGTQSFTLVLTWTKSVTAHAISALATDFAFVAVITPPTGGYLAPAAGTITLAGGADAVVQPAVKASATVLSAS